MSASVDHLFSSMFNEAVAKFGKEKVLPIDALNMTMCGVPCPMAWGYVIGGSSVVPCGRVIGGDGPPGTFKSALAMEHAIWFLNAGGAAVLIDTEEKTSDTLVKSMLYRVPPDVRRRFTYVKASSIDEAQRIITFFKDKAKMFRKELKPDQQFPMLLIWDSLTGAGTESQIDKVAKEGSAAARAYPEQAMQIANFYRSYVVDDAFLTLLHVQHAKKNNDPHAVGDDEYIPNGGVEPKYKSTYHFRMLSVKDIESKDWAGKEVRLKMIKSGLGENHRKLTVRVLWRHEWCMLPMFDHDGNVIPSDPIQMVPVDEAIAAFNVWMADLDIKQAQAVLKFMRLDDAKPGDTVPMPACDQRRLQRTWFDWDWALGNLLIDMRYGDLCYAADRQKLEEIVPFERVGKEGVRCPLLFGDEDERSVSEFGRAAAQHPTVSQQLRVFLTITPYKTVSEFVREDIPRRSKRAKEA